MAEGVVVGWGGVMQEFSVQLWQWQYSPSRGSLLRVSDSSPRHSLQCNQTLKYFSRTGCSDLIFEVVEVEIIVKW